MTDFAEHLEEVLKQVELNRPISRKDFYVGICLLGHFLLNQHRPQTMKAREVVPACVDMAELVLDYLKEKENGTSDPKS